MDANCPPIEMFEDLLMGDPDDPRRMHMNDCPRCRARMTAFATFMQIDPLPEGARLEEARRHLTASIRDVAARRSPSRKAWTPFSWFRISGPIWKPALGLASILLIVGIFLQVGPDRRIETGPVLRDAAPVAPPGVPLVSGASAGGGVQLRWRAVPSAEGYRVHIYGSDLVELSVLELRADTSITLSPDRLAALASSGKPVIWRVGIVRNGDEVSLTPPATFRLP
jgi:hypothetical protein